MSKRSILLVDDENSFRTLIGRELERAGYEVEGAGGIEEGRRAVGIKNVTINESYFQGHFPSDPVMPGVLIVEAMAQTAAVLVVHTLGAAFEAKERFVFIQVFQVCAAKDRPADGAWCAELEGDTILESETILLLAYLGREGSPLAGRAAAYLVEKQLADGGWSM